MNERTKKFEKQGISRDRYMELKYVARQYDKMRNVPEKASRVQAIQEAAEAACGEVIAPFILQNVCRGVMYEHMPVPCGRAYFFAQRRRFFLELNQRL